MNTNDDAVLIELGKYLTQEILYNTDDKTNKFEVKVTNETENSE